MRDEGVIKFECRWQPTASMSAESLVTLIECRNRLFKENLIGVYDDGIGFGNISIRYGAPGQFVISASQTGHIADLTAEGYSLVTAYDVSENWCSCEGPAKASSESLTHGMIYSLFPQANAVIHVHQNKAWKDLQGRVVTSSPDVPYGTPAMAAEVARLAREAGLGTTKFFVMAGHEDGILAFGEDLNEAYRILHENLALADCAQRRS